MAESDGDYRQNVACIKPQLAYPGSESSRMQAFYFNFTCEITKLLSWQRFLQLSANMVSRFKDVFASS